jgi:hypothetical protein
MGTIKRVKFGDGNTKFFHANATINFRKNTITTLTDAYTGVIVTNIEITAQRQISYGKLTKTDLELQSFHRYISIRKCYSSDTIILSL